MDWFLAALAVFLAGGVLSFLVGQSARAACLIGAASAMTGGTIVVWRSVLVLLSGEPVGLRAAWSWPLGSANMEIDALSAVFAAVIGLVTALAALYGSQYLQSHAGKKNLGVSWFFFNLLAAGMVTVVAARNGVLFLVAWEIMSVASFFLVASDDDKEGVRRAAWIYLVATHVGTAFLLVLFTLLGKGVGSLDFDQLSTGAAPGGVFFVLALLGFGTKAGFVPMHVWLPEAHPAAPSHVSAVMSGVMIKTGVYGLLRMFTLLDSPPAWWGWTFVGVGVVSGVLGVLYALSQRDLKRLLAYCSVENVGVIALGLGVGLLGVTYDHPTMAFLGFTGCLLHVVNHALFKSLLFLGAGSVLHAAGTLDIERLGGLLKRMPWTGAAFALGAAAIAGLPPLNGFVGEFLIYLGAMSGMVGQADFATAWPMLCVSALGGLALIGGLAAACFAKAFGIAFLGEPRSDAAAGSHEAGWAMRAPMLLLAGLCVAVGLTAPVWPLALQPAVAVILPEQVPMPLGGRGEMLSLASNGLPSPRLPLGARAGASEPTAGVVPEIAPDVAAQIAGPLSGVVLGSCVVWGLILLLAQVRRRLLAGRTVEQVVTWDCGYVAPSPRMQYSGSSFTRPITLLFRLFLRPRDDVRRPRGLFPKRAILRTHSPDLFRRFLFDPLFLGIAWTASKLRWLQEGRIQIYVLYVALTILVLLIWKLG